MVYLLHCFYTVGWASGRASDLSSKSPRRGLTAIAMWSWP